MHLPCQQVFSKWRSRSNNTRCVATRMKVLKLLETSTSFRIKTIKRKILIHLVRQACQLITKAQSSAVMVSAAAISSGILSTTNKDLNLFLCSITITKLSNSHSSRYFLTILLRSSKRFRSSLTRGKTNNRTSNKKLSRKRKM